VDRLIHVIHTCPSLASHALRLATSHIYQLRDVNLYHAMAAAYDSVQAEAGLPPSAEVAPLDTKWLEQTTKRNKEDRSRLESELKNYTNTMIKESIRVRCRFVLYAQLTCLRETS
jgi:COP9 signalosome complex subunit 1